MKRALYTLAALIVPAGLAVARVVLRPKKR